MTSIPQLRKDIAGLQDQVRKLQKELSDEKSKPPVIKEVIKEVKVPSVKVIEKPVEVIKTVTEYKDDPEKDRIILSLRRKIDRMKEKEPEIKVITKVVEVEGKTKVIKEPAPPPVVVTKVVEVEDKSKISDMKKEIRSLKRQLTEAKKRQIVTKVVEKEVPGPERVKYVDRIEYVQKNVVVEKPVEVIKEVEVEVPGPERIVTKEVEVLGPERIVYKDVDRVVYRDNPKHIEMIKKLRGNK